MIRRVVILPGDGIGPEVSAEARRVLERTAASAGETIEISELPVGGAAIDSCGIPLPEATLNACAQADAIFLGAVGGPQWNTLPPARRPEQALLTLRKHFDLFANLRPVRTFPGLEGHSPLRPELAAGTDLLFVRELTSGLYFGERREDDGDGVAYDTMFYTKAQVSRIAAVAFRLAGMRRSKLASIDKANVLASMRLWRKTVDEVGVAYPHIECTHLLVDAAAMHLLTRPTTFDVILAPNLFGDILSDEASVLAGSLGMLPSASLGTGTFGMYEPIHGSAPDIAGQGRANPIGAILSVAMMWEHSFGRPDLAGLIADAVDAALEDGARTTDLCAPGNNRTLSTSEMADRILVALSS